MDAASHIAHLRADSAALLAACQAEPNAAVPTCPGWDRTALLAHVGGVHAWARAQLSRGPEERIGFRGAERPPVDGTLPAWFENGVEVLAEALSAMDVEATWPSWAGPQPGSFYPRRMAQDTAMHRHDVDPSPIDALLAIDGIDEHLELFAPRIAPDRLAGATGTIHLHATDLDGEPSGAGGGADATDAHLGEWLIHLGPDGIGFERGHAKGDVAVRGAARDLLLWIWNRIPADDEALQVFGDPQLLRLWRTAVTF
jgi:uncharacterized protein (TIGR03083 family)